VDCQIKALESCLDYPMLRAALKDLPRTLDETYSRVLESIPRDHIQYAKTVLMLLTWSQRPLRLDEIVDAVAVDLEASPTFDPRNRLPYPKGNLPVFQSLVSVVENTDGQDQDQERNWQVQLAHFSVREFLLSGRVHGFLGLRMDQSFANAHIAKICLAYLSVVTAHSLSLEDMKSQFPFAQYSAEYWTGHVREAEVTDHVLSDVVAALQAASSKGHDMMVQILLDGGAYVNAHGGEYGTALQAASANGHINILKMLLRNGADINARNGRYGAALNAALLSGSHEIVQTLLDMGADVNAQDESSDTALYEASQKGLDQIVRMLLDHGAETNARGGEYGTALQVAAFEGHHGIVQTLVDHGADVNAQSHNHGTALRIASEGGHESIVRILIDSGAGQPARSSKHQEGHSNVAYSEFHDSGYSSRHTQPIVDDPKGAASQPFDDDIESVGTVETDIQSSTESLALSNVREAAAREIAKAFNEDDEISKLYDEGLRRMDDSRFIENHRRLLKLFYLEAAKDAEVASDHVVLRFLRSRVARIRVSARIIKAKDPLDDDSELDAPRGQLLRLIHGSLSQADKLRDISRWTQEQQSDPNKQPGIAHVLPPDLPANDMDDDDDFDANNEEEAGLRMDDLPALVNMTAFLMDGRAFRIYRNNLQRLAYGKSIAPTAFRHALVADDLVLAIELLENEPEAVTQSRLGFEWIKEPLAMGFVPSEVVRLIIRQQEDPSWKEEGNQAIGVGRWNKARESIRGEEPGASHKRLITEYFIATGRQAINSPEQQHNPPPPMESKPALENLPWKYSPGSLKTKTNAICLDVWKQGMSRIRESMIWSGLILGPLQSGHTRITWKNVSSVSYSLL
jgi:ankyrin repeat protein